MLAARKVVSALVLDDEPRYREFLSEVLRGMGCEPAMAGTAAEAARLTRARKPDLLMLDLNLPVTDGISFLEEFRRYCPGARVIVLTGFGDLDSARRAIHLGVTEFLTKPCDLGQLEQAIGRACRGSAPQVETPLESAPDLDGVARDDLSLASVERGAILRALRECGGNRSEAARRLGISRRSLYNKIAQYRREGPAAL